MNLNGRSLSQKKITSLLIGPKDRFVYVTSKFDTVAGYAEDYIVTKKKAFIIRFPLDAQVKYIDLESPTSVKIPHNIPSTHFQVAACGENIGEEKDLHFIPM